MRTTHWSERMHWACRTSWRSWPETDWPVPEAGRSRHVLIDVKAAGLNFPDVLIIQGKYQFQPEMPFIPAVSAPVWSRPWETR